MAYTCVMSASSTSSIVSTVRGDVSLPTGFRHPHASAQARDIATRGTILRAQVGSGVHGTSISGQDDRDEMGICLEPSRFVTGLAQVPDGIDGIDDVVRFEQYQRHTAWDRDGGLANRSGAGDLDVVIYSARKWCRLAPAGNPSVLLLLFVPDHEVVHRSPEGAELVAQADRFVSRIAGAKFLGYLRSQREGMLGQGRAPRRELMSENGYDTKFAMHALRLGVQGVELLRTGRISLPVPEPELGFLRAVRRGEVRLVEVLEVLDELVDTLDRLRSSSSVPAEPDRQWVDSWLQRTHLAYWARTEQVSSGR